MISYSINTGKNRDLRTPPTCPDIVELREVAPPSCFPAKHLRNRRSWCLSIVRLLLTKRRIPIASSVTSVRASEPPYVPGEIELVVVLEPARGYTQRLVNALIEKTLIDVIRSIDRRDEIRTIPNEELIVRCRWHAIHNAEAPNAPHLGVVTVVFGIRDVVHRWVRDTDETASLVVRECVAE